MKNTQTSIVRKSQIHKLRWLKTWIKNTQTSIVRKSQTSLVEKIHKKTHNLKNSQKLCWLKKKKTHGV